MSEANGNSLHSLVGLSGFRCIVADPPWPYVRITMEFVLRGKGLKEKDVAQAIHLSETRYCSVAATIRPAAEIITSYQIIEDE